MTSRRLAAPMAAALLLVGGGVGACVRWVARPVVVAGLSMQPALCDGDRVLVELWSYRRRPPRPGEVALLETEGGRSLLKRVASEAIPGEAFGESAFLVLGDNAAQSDDSRRFGPVPRERFRGRAIFRYWPPPRAGSIR